MIASRVAAARLGRDRRAVQARRRERVEVADGQHVQAVDAHRIGKQQVIGEPAGDRDHVCGGHPAGAR